MLGAARLAVLVRAASRFRRRALHPGGRTKPLLPSGVRRHCTRRPGQNHGLAGHAGRRLEGGSGRARPLRLAAFAGPAGRGRDERCNRPAKQSGDRCNRSATAGRRTAVSKPESHTTKARNFGPFRPCTRAFAIRQPIGAPGSSSAVSARFRALLRISPTDRACSWPQTGTPLPPSTRRKARQRFH
jgi:hypothetical protein